MTTATNRYLDAVKIKLGIPSDGQLAAHWNITKQRISHYRSGESALGDDRCFEVAEILGIPPEKVLLEIQAERARKAGNAKVSEVLENVLRRLAASPAVYVFCAMAIGVILTPETAVAQTQQTAAICKSDTHNGQNLHYVKLCIRRLFALLARFSPSPRVPLFFPFRLC